MAKDRPSPDEMSSKPEAAEPPDVRQSGGDDEAFESEREALKKARENEAPGFDGGEGAAGYGNLHFGDGPPDDQQSPAATERGGADFSGGVAPLPPGRPAKTPGRDEKSSDTESSGLSEPRGASDEITTPGMRSAAKQLVTDAKGPLASVDSEGRQPASAQEEFSVPSGRNAVKSAPVNEAPTDIVLSADTVAENAEGAVVAALSAIDPDAGETAAFAITDDASGLFEIAGGELKLKAGASLDFEARDSYAITIEVTDKAGNTYSKTVTINVADVNESPSDIALSGTVFAENAEGAVVATLTAVDPDAGESAVFAISNDPSGLFEIAGSQLKLKSGVAADFEAQDSYDLTLSVTDSAGNAYDKTVTISVADVNEAPTDIVLSSSMMAEGAEGAVVATLSAVDEDFNDSATFAIVDDASGLFEIAGSQLKLKPGAAADFEAQDAHTLTLSVTDSAGNAYQKTVTLSVTDVNEAPTDILLSANTVFENAAGAVVGSLAAIDPDFADTATITIADDASGMFEIVGDQLRLKPDASLNHEAQDAYDVSLEATDSAGNSFLKTVTVNVADVNEAPKAIILSSTTVVENLPGAVVGAVSALDPDGGDSASFSVSDDRFEIVDGELKLKPGVAFDFETAGPMDVVITATDAGGLSHEQTFTINVADANEGPALSLVSSAGLKASYYNVGRALSNLNQIDFSAAPDAEGVVDSLNYMQGQERFWDGGPADYFAAKYEGDLVVGEGGTYTFYMASDDGSMLFIDGVAVLDNDGLHGTQTRTVTVNLDSGAHDIEVRYFENGGSQTLQLAWAGPDTGGVRQVIGGDAFEHGARADNLSVPDDAPGAIVAQLAVADPDAGDFHAFLVSDDRFEVVEDGGSFVLKLKDGVSIDYETETSVNVAVTVTDSGGATDTMNVVIAVDDTNAAPQIALSGGEGLQASYYNIGRALSDLDQIDFNAPPDAEGVVDSLNYMQGQERFWDGAPGDYFAAKYEGQLMVGDGGRYTFNLASDDGSMLFIDGVAVLDNDGLHSTRTRSVTLDLEPGAHDIEVRYFENGGDQTLRLSWSGPDTGNVDEVIGGASYRVPGFTDADRIGLTENAAGDSAAILSIVDPDGDAVTIAVSDDRFEVVESDLGYVLKLKDGVSVDYEAASEINVTVTATDAHGESASQSFLIPVADVNEAPTGLALSPASGAGALVLNTDGGVDDAAVARDMEGFPTDALTVEVLFSSSQTDVGNGTPLFSYAASNGSDNEVLLWLEGSSGKLQVFLAGQKINTGVSNATLLDGEPHQVSVTWDQASDALKVYINGESAFATTVNIRDLKSGGTLAFGQEQDSEGGGFNAGQVFEGQISEVRIFDYARSDAEIADHAGAPIGDPETEPGLVNNWTMNAASGGAIEDLVGVDHLQLRNGAHVEGGESFDVPTVVENVPGAVAGVLSAFDPQSGGEVSQFIIVSDPSGAFEIVGAELRLKSGVALDYETQNAYDVTVEAVGAGGERSQQVVTVNVANVNEAPVDFALRPASTPNALSLNMDGGSNDAAIAANMEGFPTDALTVEVRFASGDADVGNGAPLFSYAANDGSNNEALLFLEGASGRLQIYLAGQKIDTGVTNASLLDGAEHQVSFSWDQTSNALKLYVDGQSAFETTINIRDLKSGGSLVFGQEQDTEGGGYDSAQVFTGEIFEVRIFDYARSDAEIADNAGAPIGDPETEPGLVNNWTMSSGVGGAVEDLVGVDNLVLQNGASVSASEYLSTPLIAENDAGAVVGTLSATDPNTGGPVAAFAIADDPSGLFEIVGTQLKLKAGAAFDYETQTSHVVTVEAVASNGEKTPMTLTIEVADIDELNVINGTSGNDNLRGSAQADAIYGFDGNDTLDGRGGADELYGGDGNDTIYADSDDTVIDGGAGSDRVIVRGNNDFSIDMAASNVERVDGAAGNDTIDASGMTDAARQYGNDGDDVLIGGAGNDTQRGGAGNDRIFGNDGNDRIYGDAGADELYGGAGNDTIYADSDDTVIDGGAGTDRIIVQGAGDFVIDMAASSVERVDGAAGNDTIDASGMTDAARQYGNDGDDVLIGGAGNDTQRGGAGNDRIFGNDGNDRIYGDAGADELYGGAGNDTIYADSDDTVIDGGAGTDRVIVQGDGDFSIDLAASSVERVDGAGGNDTLDGSGATSRVRLYGNGGDDMLIGGSANDVLNGGDGNDTLVGNGGNDNMTGGAGDDTFIGGAGSDTMSGGDGADWFLYAMGDGSDRITGGAGGWTDVIQLSDGATPLGEYGTDWTVDLTEGSIVSSDENGLIFSEDSSGVITMSDGSTINFSEIEQIVF